MPPLDQTSSHAAEEPEQKLKRTVMKSAFIFAKTSLLDIRLPNDRHTLAYFLFLRLQCIPLTVDKRIPDPMFPSDVIILGGVVTPLSFDVGSEETESVDSLLSSVLLDVILGVSSEVVRVVVLIGGLVPPWTSLVV